LEQSGLRQEFVDYATTHGLNPFSLARKMQDEYGISVNHETLRKFMSDDTKKVERDGSRSATTLKKIDMFLKRTKYGPNWSEQSEISSISDALFVGYCQQFGVKKGHLDKCNIMEGTYQFYANSEFRPLKDKKGDHFIVVGAMHFYTSNLTNAREFYEKQQSTTVMQGVNGKSTPLVRTELWDGYYFMRKDMVITICKGPEDVPKFYVLKPLHRDLESGAVAELRGIMSKIGIDGGDFKSSILMYRDPLAFERCRVVRVGPNGGGGIDPDIVRFLRP
jgi:hypothetical protein